MQQETLRRNGGSSFSVRLFTQSSYGNGGSQNRKSQMDDSRIRAYHNGSNGACLAIQPIIQIRSFDLANFGER